MVGTTKELGGDKESDVAPLLLREANRPESRQLLCCAAGWRLHASQELLNGVVGDPIRFDIVEADLSARVLRTVAT